MTQNRFQILQITFSVFGSKKFQGDFKDICPFLAIFKEIQGVQGEIIFLRRFKEFKEEWSP